MHEYTYNYAIIEHVEQGIHPIVNKIKTYEWSNDNKGFVECEEPKEIKSIYNFSIG